MKTIAAMTLIASCSCLSATAYAQGEEAKQLTFDPYLNGYPDWSPDGKWVVYTAVVNDVETIWKVPAEGGDPVRVTKYSAHHARFSPDGLYIAFDGEQGTVVRVMASAGGVPIRIVPESMPVEQSGYPCWSPNGAKVAFRSVNDLWTVDLRTGRFAKLFHKDGFIPIAVSWSEKDDSILMALLNPKDRKVDIWKMPAGGGDPRQLTFSGDVRNASVSPDGTTILFTSQTSGNWDLWIMPFEGGTPVQLTFNESQDMEACWSPSGDQVAFRSNRSGNPDIWVLKIDPKRIGEELKARNSK